jgi:hypothetical protein
MFRPVALKSVAHHPDGVPWPRHHPGGSDQMPVVLLEMQMRNDPRFQRRLGAETLAGWMTRLKKLPTTRLKQLPHLRGSLCSPDWEITLGEDFRHRVPESLDGCIHCGEQRTMKPSSPSN